jgi:histidine triad (HIT) family protein
VFPVGRTGRTDLFRPAGREIDCSSHDTSDIESLFDFRPVALASQGCDAGRVSDVICAIAAEELEAEVVLRTTQVVAFLDHRPVFKGHVLVCPLPHVATLPDMPPSQLSTLFEYVQRVAGALPRALGCTGTFVAINNVVSQSIPHLHVHVVPRTKGDGLRGFFWPRTKYADGELAEYGARIRGVLESA